MVSVSIRVRVHMTGTVVDLRLIEVRVIVRVIRDIKSSK
jgi:hypothetical protein